MDSPRPRTPGARPFREPPPVDWRQVGLRRTPQREVVLNLVRSCLDHPTAEWIHLEARRTLPDISLATVYRTLRLLKEKGLIREFSGGASPSRFDGTLHVHEHVRCVRCGAVSDVELPEAGDIREMVGRRTGFRVARYPLLFHGLCEKCSARVVEAPSANGLPGTSPAAPDAPSSPAPGDPEDPDRHWVEGFW